MFLFMLFLSVQVSAANSNLATITANAISMTKELVAMDTTSPPGMKLGRRSA